MFWDDTITSELKMVEKTKRHFPQLSSGYLEFDLGYELQGYLESTAKHFTSRYGLDHNFKQTLTLEKISIFLMETVIVDTGNG